jgi:hypothetical protein
MSIDCPFTTGANAGCGNYPQVGIIDTGKWTKTTRVPPATSSSGVLEVENGVTLDYLKSAAALATDANGKIILGTGGPGGGISGPATSVVGHTAIWNNTSGTVLADSGVAAPQNKGVGTNTFLTGYNASTGAFTAAQPSFANLSGSIAVTQMNGGTGAGPTTFWRGDGTWVAPAGGGNVTGPATSTAGNLAIYNDATGKVLANGNPPPLNAAAAANNFLTSYTAASGAFTSAQPLFSNLGGTIAISQFGATGTPSSTTYLRGDNTWSTPGGAGNPPLNTIAAATAANTPILNGNWPQTWDWSITSNGTGFGAFNIGENAPSTGTGNILRVTTASGSAAAPLQVSAHGTAGFTVDATGNLNLTGTAKLVLPNIVSKCLVTDASGNVIGTAGLCLTAPSTTNLLAGDGAGGIANSAIAPGNVATTTNAIALMNGTTATTQPAGDNSTKLATTAYVDRTAYANVFTQPGLLNTTGTIPITGPGCSSNTCTMVTPGADGTYRFIYQAATTTSATGACSSGGSVDIRLSYQDPDTGTSFSSALVSARAINGTSLVQHLTLGFTAPPPIANIFYGFFEFRAKQSVPVTLDIFQAAGTAACTAAPAYTIRTVLVALPY